MRILTLVAAALVLAVSAGSVKAQCNHACPAPQVQQLKVQQVQQTYAAPVILQQVQPQYLYVVPSAPTVQLQAYAPAPIVIQRVEVQRVEVQRVKEQKAQVQKQRVQRVEVQPQPRTRSLTIQRIRTR